MMICLCWCCVHTPENVNVESSVVEKMWFGYFFAKYVTVYKHWAIYLCCQKFLFISSYHLAGLFIIYVADNKIHLWPARFMYCRRTFCLCSSSDVSLSWHYWYNCIYIFKNARDSYPHALRLQEALCTYRFHSQLSNQLPSLRN